MRPLFSSWPWLSGDSLPQMYVHGHTCRHHLAPRVLGPGVGAGRKTPPSRRRAGSQLGPQPVGEPLLGLIEAVGSRHHGLDLLRQFDAVTREAIAIPQQE